MGSSAIGLSARVVGSDSVFDSDEDESSDDKDTTSDFGSEEVVD